MHWPEHLTTIAAIARALVGEAPLSDRFGRALAALHTSVPFACARVVVLRHKAWSYVAPPPPPGASGLPWPLDRTAEIIRQREPRSYVDRDGTYYGWPIVWQAELFGVLELWLPAGGSVVDHERVVEACLPLWAAAMAGTPHSLAPYHASAVVDTGPLDELRRLLEAPLLLQPLIRIVLEWVARHAPVAQASIHLPRWDGAEAKLVSFALLEHSEVAQQRAVEDEHPRDSALGFRLARRALDHKQPIWGRNGHGLEYSMPLTTRDEAEGALTVAGQALEARHIRLLTDAAPVIGAALRRAEFYHALADARTQLQQVFDGLPIGLALLDGEGRLLRANGEWPRVWGLDPRMVQAQQLVPWDMFEPLLQRLPDPLAFDAFFRRWDHEPREATIVLQRPHQELHMQLVPMLDSLGLRPSYLLAVGDVTRARELDRLKSEFVSVVSHELRTPLTSILGYTELLQARDFPASERRELLDTIWKQATHLSSLVEDLLNVSRIDAGRITLSRWVLSLGQVVRELTAQLNKTLDQSRHRLLIDIGDRLPPVYADRDRLRQILGNLLSNAIKYSPAGGEIILQASVLQGQPAGAPALPPEPALLISVHDPGIGIPAEELPRIFERFYRIDNSNTRKIGGTGLGLAITQALVELHGGRIWAESVPGVGSTFFFTLPLATNVLHSKG